jgi:TM2 domain-containing membrane protein YozV
MLIGMSKPGVAAVLSLILPGVGQIYNGEFWRGIFWLIITPGFWIGSGGLLGWVAHLIASYTAYRRAVRLEPRLPSGSVPG